MEVRGSDINWEEEEFNPLSHSSYTLHPSKLNHLFSSANSIVPCTSSPLPLSLRRQATNQSINFETSTFLYASSHSRQVLKPPSNYRFEPPSFPIWSSGQRDRSQATISNLLNTAILSILSVLFSISLSTLRSAINSAHPFKGTFRLRPSFECLILSSVYLSIQRPGTISGLECPRP